MKMQGVGNAGKENAAQNCKSKKMRKGKMKHKIAEVENAEKVTYVIKLKQHKI